MLSFSLPCSSVAQKLLFLLNGCRGMCEKCVTGAYDIIFFVKID